MMKGKPTGSRDALLCVQDLGPVPPKPPDFLDSKPRSPLPSNQVATAMAPLSAIPGQLSASVSADAILPIRNRASSFKRKAGEQAAAAAAKVIRLASSSADLVSKLSDNKILVDKIAFDVSSEDFIDNVNPGLVDLLSKISLAMSSQHTMISDVVSEVQGLKTTVTELCSEYSKQSNDCALSFPTLESTSKPSSVPSVAGISKVNSRQPLRQAPLGTEHGPWIQAVRKKPQKAKGVTAAAVSADTGISSVANLDEDDIFCLSDPPAGNKPPPPKADPFLAAVKEAERSVLIHNLNLGQAPTLNPSTISSKVTAALLLCIAKCEPSSGGVVNAFVREIADDIMSMVQGMTFFGSVTRPSKNPSNSSENGSFYTIPVKLSFQNRQVASKIFETLRKYKVQVTTPYHKSLRASFALVQAKIRAENPGYQVRVNLDLNKKALKAFVRPNVEHAERYPWEFVGKPIPLPPDALNPKITEVEKMVLPTSPVLTTSDSAMVTDPGNKGSPPPSGSPSNRKKNSRSGSTAATAGNETTAGDGGGTGSAPRSVGGISTSNRFESLSQSTPPPSSRNEKSHAAR
jgi:hypothetical protein